MLLPLLADAMDGGQEYILYGVWLLVMVLGFCNIKLSMRRKCRPLSILLGLPLVAGGAWLIRVSVGNHGVRCFLSSDGWAWVLLLALLPVAVGLTPVFVALFSRRRRPPAQSGADDREAAPPVC